MPPKKPTKVKEPTSPQIDVQSLFVAAKNIVEAETPQSVDAKPWGNVTSSDKRVEMSHSEINVMGDILVSKLSPEERERILPTIDKDTSKDFLDSFNVPEGTPVLFGDEADLLQAAAKLQAQPFGSGGGYKLDTGKPRWDLAPMDGFECVVKVMTWAVDKKVRGERAYPERNWERGMSWGRVYGAMIRHAWKWWLGKLGLPGHSILDDESGMPHSWHFLTCAAFLVTYELRGMNEFDDRPVGIAEKPNK